MLKTNSKKARENVRAYILRGYDPSNYHETPENPTFAQVAADVWATFTSEKSHDLQRYNTQEVFADWCSGLPSIIDTCYYYNRSAVDDLGAILEETEEERNRFSESEAAQLLSLLIFREIQKEVAKNA